MAFDYQTPVNYGFQPSFDASKSFTGGLGNFSKAGKKSSGGGMDFLTPFIGGAIGGVTELLGAPARAEAQAQALRFQNLAQNAAIEEGRQRSYGDLANQLGGRLASLTYGPDIDYGRGLESFKYQTGAGAEKKFGLMQEELKRKRAFQMDPQTRAAEAQARRGQMEEDAFKASLPGANMFGATGPFASLAGKYGFAFGGAA